MLYDEQHWEDLYMQTRAEALPWNAGKPDADLMRLVENGQIPVGQALDIGTGPGHDAVYLISKGFNVIAIDISSSAVQLARENASAAGLFGFFQKGDIREIPVEDTFIDFVNDRGCFHFLTPADQPKAVDEIHRVLRRRGLFLLRVFSEKESSGGPHPFTRVELEKLFAPQFEILELWEGVFEGPPERTILDSGRPGKPASYSLLMEKK